MGSKPTRALPAFISLNGEKIQCVCLGAKGVGKSTLCKNGLWQDAVGQCEIVMQAMESRHKTTLAEYEAHLKKLGVPSTLETYLLLADVILLCFAIDSIASFQELQQFVPIMRKVKTDSFYPVILVGCKGDLHHTREVSIEQARLFEMQIKAWTYVEISSQDDVNHSLARDIVRARECSAPHAALVNKYRLYQTEIQQTTELISFLHSVLNVDCGNVCLAYVPLCVPLPCVRRTQSLKKAARSDREYVKRRMEIALGLLE